MSGFNTQKTWGSIGNNSGTNNQPSATGFGTTGGFGSTAGGFGTQQTNTGFGSNTGSFGTQPTGFGNQQSNSGFGSSGGFGASLPATSTASVGFNSQPTSGFGQQPSGFGSTSTGFGQNTSSGFGQTANSGFGNAQPSGFGTANKTGFGNAQSSGFGQSNSGFGQTSGGFGTSTNTGSGFGQTTGGFGTKSGTTGFGSAGNTFGQPTTTGFGQTANTGFGQAASSGFGQPATTGFGQKANTGFGQPASSGFGQTNSTGFGQTGSTGFGQTGSTGFGQTGSTGFGQSSNTGFGQTSSAGFGQTANTGFGQKTNTGFGASTNTGFGQTANTGFGQPANTGFGASANTGFNPSNSTLFGGNASNSLGQTGFGQNMAFGQQNNPNNFNQAQNPTQPIFDDKLLYLAKLNPQIKLKDLSQDVISFLLSVRREVKDTLLQAETTCNSIKGIESNLEELKFKNAQFHINLCHKQSRLRPMVRDLVRMYNSTPTREHDLLPIQLAMDKTHPDNQKKAHHLIISRVRSKVENSYSMLMEHLMDTKNLKVAYFNLTGRFSKWFRLAFNTNLLFLDLLDLFSQHRGFIEQLLASFERLSKASLSSTQVNQVGSNLYPLLHHSSATTSFIHNLFKKFATQITYSYPQNLGFRQLTLLEIAEHDVKPVHLAYPYYLPPATKPYLDLPYLQSNSNPTAATGSKAQDTHLLQKLQAFTIQPPNSLATNTTGQQPKAVNQF